MDEDRTEGLQKRVMEEVYLRIGTTVRAQSLLNMDIYAMSLGAGRLLWHREFDLPQEVDNPGSATYRHATQAVALHSVVPYLQLTEALIRISGYMPELPSLRGPFQFYCNIVDYWDLTLRVRINAHLADNSIDTFEVKRSVGDSVEWLDFATYLQKLVRDKKFRTSWVYSLTVGQRGYNTMFHWYRIINKPFRFLDLPLELRREIYAQWIGPDVYPLKRIYGSDSNDVYLGLRPIWGAYDGGYFCKEATQQGSATSGLGTTCKQIRVEMLEFLWACTCMKFRFNHDLSGIASIRSALPTYALKHISLNFSNGQYIRFFGVRFTVRDYAVTTQDEVTLKIHPLTGEAAATILKDGRLPNLKRLDLEFRATSSLPWTDIIDVEWFRGLRPSSLRPCQKAIVIFILTFAFDYVYGIDNITLGGDIKDSTRIDFAEAIEEKKMAPSKEPGWYYTKPRLFNNKRKRYVRFVLKYRAMIDSNQPLLVSLYAALLPLEYQIPDR
jgi:hypothetical protein